MPGAALVPSAYTLPRFIPARLLDVWMTSLPPRSMIHQVRSAEARYDQDALATDRIVITSVQVAEQQVWFFTDIDFYAYGPPTGLQAPPKRFSQGELVGLLTFELLFGARAPLQTPAERLSAYSAPNDAATSTSGWPFIATPFGVQRMPSFALWARSSEEIEVQAVVENVPRFPITKVGFNLHGFILPESLFDNIWVKFAEEGMGPEVIPTEE